MHLKKKKSIYSNDERCHSLLHTFERFPSEQQMLALFKKTQSTWWHFQEKEVAQRLLVVCYNIMCNIMLTTTTFIRISW